MITEKIARATEPAIAQPKSFVLGRFLPWIIGGVGLLVYLATLNHWVSFGSLLQVARVSGWLWQPELYGPLYWVVTYPLRWLPSQTIPIALNLFAAVCGSLTLVLLARSVMLLPHDRTLEQRQREKSEFSILTIRTAWLTPVVAAIACGLQLTFWEHATAASSEMLDLLLFAYVIRCLLEFRVSDRQSWLTRAALVYGLTIPSNYAMIGFFPLFLVALVWLKGLSFFNLRFLSRMALFGSIGLLFYLLLPLLQSRADFFPVPFWQGLGANLNAQKTTLATLLNKYVLFHGEKPLWLLALPSLVPLLLISIRWPSYFGDSSQIGIAVATLVFNLISAFFLAFCLWIAFDPPLSPRNYRIGVPPLLTFAYFGALCIGYFVGYFLLVFGTKPERARRTPSVLSFINTTVVLGVWVVALLTPALLLYRNLPNVRATNGPQLKNFARLLAQGLPREPAIVLGDDARKLVLLRLIMRENRTERNYLPIETASLQWPDYVRMLHKQDPQRWPFDPAKSERRPFDNGEQKMMLQTLGRSNTLYYLHPSFGFHFESFYPEPRGVVYKLVPYPEETLLPPALSTNLVAENETFWTTVNQTCLDPLLHAIVPPDSGSKRSVMKTIMLRAHLNWLPNNDATVLGNYYSRALNNWGVEMQKHERLDRASAHFQRALELNQDNLVAQINLDCNKSLQAHKKISGQITKSVEDAFGRYRSWDQIMNENGPFDDPNFCYEQGRVFLNFHLFHQAAAEFERATQLAPDNLLSRLFLAQIYVVKNMPQQALKLVNQIHEQAGQITIHRTNQAELLYVEASAYLANHDLKSAENAINSLLEKYPGDDDLTLTAMKVYTAYGFLTNALQAIEQQLKIYPTNASALVNKGFFCIRVKAYDEAIAASLKALSLDAKNDSARFNLAIAYLESDKLADSQREYETLLKLYPTAPQIHYGLQQLAYLQKQTNAAVRYCQLYLSNAPPNTGEAKLVSDRLKELTSAKQQKQ